jgi:hypothetical protein
VQIIKLAIIVLYTVTLEKTHEKVKQDRTGIYKGDL